jgi:hypothetical protein
MTGGYSTPIGPECKVTVPVRRDKRLSDGELHAVTAWSWFEGELWERFAVVRWSSGLEFGQWPDKTGQPIGDWSKVYTVAIPDDKVDELRRLLMEACAYFYQECMYLVVGGRAELIYPPPGTWPELASQ